ncbi:MAG: hypothetical protein COA32_12165 [Fluviicola sp.]|nr:MAG: hypothetical protein COA32_12165 [Fluviicola sp.]
MNKSILNGLKLNGFDDELQSFDESPFLNNKTVKLIRSFLSENFSKSKSINKTYSSYGLKHIVEYKIGEYISNGELIYSMFMEGFDLKRHNINCYFNIKTSEVKKFQL